MKTIALFAVLCLSASAASAQANSASLAQNQTEVRPEKAQAARRPQPPVLPPQEKLWEARGSLGVARDTNINHLLLNANVNSNSKRADTVTHAAAELSVRPRWKDKLSGELSYSYDRYDYQTHPTFSYFANALDLTVEPRLSRHWSAEAGGTLDWIGDANGNISNDAVGRLGLAARPRPGTLVRFGYQRRWESVTVDPLRNAHGDGGYLLAVKTLPRRHAAFASYSFNASRANGSDFSGKTQFLMLGLIEHFGDRFRLTWLASGTDRRYDNVDSRFGVRRRDDAFGGAIKPAIRLWGNVELVGAASFQHNNSNVALKRYDDEVYSLTLTGWY